MRRLALVMLGACGHAPAPALANHVAITCRGARLDLDQLATSAQCRTAEEWQSPSGVTLAIEPAPLVMRGDRAAAGEIVMRNTQDRPVVVSLSQPCAPVDTEHPTVLAPDDEVMAADFDVMVGCGWPGDDTFTVELAPHGEARHTLSLANRFPRVDSNYAGARDDTLKPGHYRVELFGIDIVKGELVVE